MTYSNINKDKVQAKGWNWLKSGVVVGGAVILIISALGNVYSQYRAIKSVEMKNAELLNKINGLNIENRRLLQKIEYATTSAFRERKAREWLGLGTGTDEWLDIPKTKQNESLYRTVTEEIQVSNVKKWLLLFTK